jgi:HK97 family phage major capsid protein
MTRLEEIEARKAEIRSEVETTEDIEKVEELEKETDALNEEVAEIEEQEKNEEVAEELEEKSFEAKEVKKEERKMENKELRNSKEYINAYAEYIKTGKDEEVRSLLTENVEGSIAVPDFVLDEVKTAWDKNEILELVRRTNVKGNLKVQFEVSGSPAVIHVEGTGAVAEEELVEGIVELKPASIKKWISISDEVMDMRGEEFLRYIYDELTYRIAKKAADELVGTIATLPQVATTESPSAAKITSAPAVGTVAEAYGNLSDEASDITIIMNKLTYADFKKAQYDNNYGVDPFEGFRVRFNNTLPAYSTAEAGAVYMLVGDLGHGAIANFPNGEGISIKVDELSRKKEDLVEILGREYVAIGVVADKSFVQIAKPTE